VSVTGAMAEDIPEEGFSTVAYVRYVPGGAAVVQLSLPPNAPEPIAGERTKLLVTVADKNGNSVPDSTIAADLKVEAGPIGNASVERSGAASIADGTGEVWVRSETATEPTEFWLSGAAPGGLAIMHSEDEPFVATWTAGNIAQFGLFLPEQEPSRVGGGRMVVGVRTEDAFGNPRGGFDGSTLVISHSPHVRFREGRGKVSLRDGMGELEIVSDSTEPFQLSLQDVARTGLRTASVLRASFQPLPGVQAVFGEIPVAPQPVGFPYPLPLLVLDRLGNVAEEYEGDVPVTMSGAARVAGRAPEIFRVVGGRATLPVLTTIAETVRFELDESAIIDKAEAARSAALRTYGKSAALTFCAADSQRLVMTLVQVESDAPTEVRAGEDVVVSIKALDAFNNLVVHQQCTFFLEVDLKPQIDETLTNAINVSHDLPQRYMLQLSQGEAIQRVPTRTAGEISLTLVQPSLRNVDVTSAARIKVAPAKAVTIDVVNMPEEGRAGLEFHLIVRALDQFGNVDESFDRSVTLDSDGAPPGMALQNGGKVHLTKGIGKISAEVAPTPPPMGPPIGRAPRGKTPP